MAWCCFTRDMPLKASDAILRSQWSLLPVVSFSFMRASGKLFFNLLIISSPKLKVFLLSSDYGATNPKQTLIPSHFRLQVHIALSMQHEPACYLFRSLNKRLVLFQNLGNNVQTAIDLLPGNN